MAAAGIVTGAPALLRGRNLSDKLNIAFIGCGGRGLTNINELTIRPPGATAPGAGRGGNAAAPTAPHPDENVVVLCDVNQVAVDAASQRFPQAAKAIDLRRVFDKPDAFDAVVVSTAEHTHAFATYLALTHGKHVYCEKPLTYNIWEARLIRETAAKYPKLSTQMGNQGHASVARRTIKEILMTGVIGPVREVHVWADRAWGLQDFESADRYDRPHGFYKDIQIVDRFKEEMPIPPTMNFDLWIGPAPTRPFHETYFPGPRWYRWWDFGNGTMSDLGSHDNDVPYTVLDIKQPLTIEATSPNGPRRPQGARARDDEGDLRVRGVAVGRAARQARLASGRQQATGMGACVGRPVATLHRRQRHAARQRDALARGKVQGLPEAGRVTPSLTRPLGGVGELRQGPRSSAWLELPGTPGGRRKRIIWATLPTAPARRSSGTT